MVDIVNLYEHQKAYYNALVERKNDKFHAIVCIPTGGGKTRLAATYSINEVLDKGKKILWVTHSKYLLNQAYSTFYNYLGQEWMEHYGVLIHSDNVYKFIDKNGKDTYVSVKRMKDITKLHQLIFVSFQSLQRCKSDWSEIIGEDVVIIIDEAHHVIAESYLNTIENYSNGKQVIGLTATPLRSKKKESNDLYRYFETNLGIRIHIATLFKNKILVRPTAIETVEFSMDTQDVYDVDDLTNGLLKEVTNYNQLILERYIKNENRYGKTVIFAINKAHVDALYDRFCEKFEGRVFRIYSDLKDREKQFQAFQESENGILINVNIMNEGVDIPDIQTIFMTKPLNSKILVTQIIGRALRKAAGKSSAFIVNFAVSNLGRKFLIVSPKMTYKLYEAEWNDNDEEIDEIEMEEANKDSIAKLVKAHMERKAICTFSNICYAGHYTIIDGEDCDIPVPVSFVEYRMIERYIVARKKGKNVAFPKKMFFCEGVECVQNYINRVLDEVDAEIVFTKYDEAIFDQFEKVYNYAKELEENIRNMNLKEKEVTDKIVSFYEYMKNNSEIFGDLLSYLSEIGTNTEIQFVRLIKTELSNIKFERL